MKLKPIIAAKAKENQKKAGGSRPVPQNSAKAVETRKEIAKKAGVSHDTINKAEKVLAGSAALDVLLEVAAISGHKSMQMLKRYTHLRAEDLVARLDQVMG